MSFVLGILCTQAQQVSLAVVCGFQLSFVNNNI